MSQHGKYEPGKGTPANLNFLEIKAALDAIQDNMPYLKRHFDLNAEALQARFKTLQAKGFTRHEAFEIIKARGLD